MKTTLTILLAVSSVAMAAILKPGTKHEYHAPLSWQKCAAGGSCSAVHGSIVMDSHWRWRHDGMIEGVEQKDYHNFGLNITGNSARLNFVTMNGASKNVGSRFYLLESEEKYQLFNLTGQEFSFDVDISTIPCAVNAALYLVSMPTDGHKSENGVGAKYGTGYCDAQCPDHRCCDEMDLWEANSMATVYTPHPCSGGKCDSGGCGYNPYNYDHTYYGPGKTVDTSKVFQVVTQFITTDGTPTGDLKEIRRVYVQDGKVIPNPAKVHNSLTDATCHYANSFLSHGGMKQMGKALHAGMVLTYSLWEDVTGDMKWLDTGNNGPCTTEHVNVEKKYPDAYVVFSNIKVGPIGSTYKH